MGFVILIFIICLIFFIHNGARNLAYRIAITKALKKDFKKGLNYDSLLQYCQKSIEDGREKFDQYVFDNVLGRLIHQRIIHQKGNHFSYIKSTTSKTIYRRPRTLK